MTSSLKMAYSRACRRLASVSNAVGFVKLSNFFNRQSHRAMAAVAFKHAKSRFEEENGSDMHELTAHTLKDCLSETGWNETEYSHKLGVESAVLNDVIAPAMKSDQKADRLEIH